MRTSRLVAFVTVLLAVAAPARAQRLPFERSFDVSRPTKLDVTTMRGKIDVTAGDSGRIVVSGTVTVRIGWDVPANAVELARRVADTPPIEREGGTIKLRPPANEAEQRAVTVSYQVRVPRDADVLAISDSGAITVRGTSGPVSVRTQSGAIDVGNLGNTVGITTGSGAVTVDGARGALTVSTSSSAETGRSLAESVRIRTSSGAVDAELNGPGDVDVETGSSGVRLRGVKRGLHVRTQSGRVEVNGTPSASWDVSSGSSSIAIGIERGTGFQVEAESGSGSVTVEGASVQGLLTKRRATGTVGKGGPLVKSHSHSGAIRVKVG